MDDAPGVSGSQPIGHCSTNLKGLLPGKLLSGEASIERIALEKLGDGEDDAALSSEIVDGQNIGMGQRRDGPRLPFESRQGLLVVGEALGQDLDCNVSAQARVAGAKDLAHPPRTQWRKNLVWPQPRSQRKSHRENLEGFYCTVFVG